MAINVEKAKKAFEGMDYQRQQDFIAKNKDFDVSKLGFKLQTAPVMTPTDNKLLPNQTSKDKFVDPISTEQQQNNTGVLSSTTQQNNTSNIPKNDIKESQKNDVISTPTEVKTNKVETPKETGPSKTDNSQQRLAEIQTNLQNYANNPDFQQYFKTQDAFNNYFGREQRTPEQQKVLDSFYTGYKAEQDKRVKDNARYLTLSTMSDTDLQNITDINDISLISLDPNLKARYDAAQKNKQIMEFVYGKDYNKVDTTPDGIDGIAGNYSEEYSKAADELTATKQEMDKIHDEIDSTFDKLVKQFEGTGTPDSYIRAKANKINSELTNQYNDLARKYNTQLGTVTALQATEDKRQQEKQLEIQSWNAKLNLYNSIYGTYEQRNTQTSDAAKTRTNPITGEAYQRNPSTSRYDIPVAGGGTQYTTQPTQTADGYVNVVRTGNNVGADTNNFGNLTNISGTAGKYKSPNGRTYAVYNTAEEGYNALITDLKAKQSGNTKTGLNSGSTIEQLLGTWVNGKGSIDKNSQYYKSFLSASGLQPGTPIGNVDTNKLARGIMAGEGTLKAYESGGKDISGTTETPTEKQYTSVQKAAMDLYLKTPSPKNAATYLSPNGLSVSDVNIYNKKQGETKIPAEQFTQLNQELTRFKSDKSVQSFEEAFSNGLSLLSSLSDKSGPGDVAAVFQFMKTLDPNSVVRESEFAVAAKSAGVFQYWKNTYDRLLKGKQLSKEQSEAFAKLSKQFVLDKASIYDIKYNDMVKRLKLQGIPEDAIPTSIADQMRLLIGGKNDNQEKSYFDTYQSIEDSSQPRTNTLKDLGINL